MGTLEILMKREGMTRKELQTLLGCSREELEDYLTGCEVLNRAGLQILAEHFGWSADYTQTMRQMLRFDAYQYYTSVQQRLRKAEENPRG